MQDPKIDVIKDEAPDSAFAFLRDSFNKLLDFVTQFLENTLLSSGAVAIGTTKSKVQSTATILYTIAGILFTKAATDDLWTPAGVNVADGFVNKYLLMLDASGNASVQEGTQAATAGAVTFTAAQLAGVTAAKKVVAVLTVATVGAPFIPGVTLLDAAGVTDTYADGAPTSALNLAYQIDPHV